MTKPAQTDIPCYTAGGAVRDRLLGRPVHDIDVVFDASEQEFIQRNPEARKVCSAPCSIFLLHGTEYTPLRPAAPSVRPAPGLFALSGPDLPRPLPAQDPGKDHPAAPREERPAALSEEHLAALRADIGRRDFTINALLLSETGLLLAHPLSFADLRDRVLRPASPAALAGDPVRAFRAARLLAALPSFSAHADCLAQMRALGPALAGIAAEQVGRETLKACLAEKPGNFPRLLHAAGCLEPWFAELAGAGEKTAGPFPYHDSSILEHTCRVMDATAEAARAAGHADPSSRQRSLAVWMALCHDLGKNLTPAFLLPRHAGHEKAGEAPALALGTRLRLPRLYIRAGILAARLHMKAGRYGELRPGTKVDLLATLHAAGMLKPFFLMAGADSGRPEILSRALDDCARMLRVFLPPEWENQGEISGKRLRELRSQALASPAG